MAKKNGTAGPGHNSTLTDDEKRALTFHHARAYEIAEALVEKAKKDRAAVVDLAKADLGRGAKADIIDLLTANTPAKMKAVVERVQRLARWAGLPIGSQPQLFEPAADQFEAGKVAGMQGDKCEPPLSLAQDQFQLWISGWHDGQAILMRAFAKKRQPAPPADPTNSSPNISENITPAQMDIEHDAPAVH
ncbi:hypothetical protein ACVWZ4_000021 [Bradyrhizobium sp. USDA 4472]